MMDNGLNISDFGFRISDFGFRILWSATLCLTPRALAPDTFFTEGRIIQYSSQWVRHPLFTMSVPQPL